MNIILEGPKGTGKSTISSYFKSKGYDYFHSSSETKNDLDYHMDLLKGDRRIIDRFSIGEMIYPIIYKRKGMLTSQEFYETMTDDNSLYIVLYASNIDLLLDRVSKRDNVNISVKDAENIITSNEMFRQIIVYLTLLFLEDDTVELNHIMIFDVSKYESDEIILKIEERLRGIENEC